MNKRSSTKKALTASIMSMALCTVLLIGATFAWFTDSVNSGTNKIQAGNLDVAFEYSKDGGTNWTEVTKDTDDLFGKDTLWEPGHVEYVNLKVSNLGSLALKYQLGIRAANETTGTNINDVEFKLSDYIKFAIVDGTKTYSANDTGRKQAVADATATGSFNISSGYKSENTLLPKKDGATDDWTIVTLIAYMPEQVGNEANYKEGTQAPAIDLGVELTATQVPHESDSFGTDYDEKAFADVSTPDELSEAAAKGGLIKLSSDITLTDQSLEFAKDAVLDMNGQTLIVNGGEGSVKSQKGTTLVVKGNGTLKGALYADGKWGTGSNIIVNANDGFTVQSSSDNGWAVYGVSGSSIEINGGTYNTAANKETVGTIYTLGNSLTVRNATINVGPDSVMNAYGIYFNAKENFIENVTVNAKYSIAVNLNNSLGRTTINGGKFVTENKAEGWNPNPTIRYQGELSISEALITRVGVGIQCATLNTTEVTGLTMEAVSSTIVNGGEEYADTAHK